MIRNLSSRAPIAALVAALALVAPCRADLPAAAFKQLPADTAFYSSMLRNREQVDIVLKSKAWAKLMDLPAVKFGLKTFNEQFAHPDAQFAPVVSFLKQPENKELLEALGEIASDEIFIYGSSGWVDLSNLMIQLTGAVQFGPLLAQVNPENRGKNPAELMARIGLQRLAQNVNLIHVPDLVIGFKTKDASKVEAQIKRLENLIGKFIGQAPPFIRDGFRRVKVGDSSLLNLTLDAKLVPWDQLHIKDYEEKEGEFDALLTKLKDLTLSVSLGVHQGYFVLAIGQSVGQLAAIGGAGKRLSELPEFKPLEQFADRPITSIGYVSKALKATTMPNAADYTEMAKTLRRALKGAELPEEIARKIGADIESFAAEFGRNLPAAGAGVSFSFLTSQGTESYDYDYSTRPGGLDGSKPLSLLEHVGGSPILCFVARTKTNPEAYKAFSKSISVLYGHVEEAVFTKIDDDQKEQYRTVKKAVVPLIKRFDEITGNLLLPALADGQFGFVLDAKWKSKHWHVAAPSTPKAMPLPEAGILLGISDEAKFRQAMKGYYALINDSLGTASEIARGQIPDIKMPEPTIEDGTGGLLAYYPLPPELAVDAQVLPMVGLAKTVVVFSLSRSHTERLLRPTPLKISSGPLAEWKGKPLASAMVFDWAALVDAAAPWIEMGVTLAKPPPVPEGPDGDVLKQVRTVLEVLKVFRSTSSATYFADGVSVTHTETLMRDLE
jgi:hypothetical protein